MIDCSRECVLPRSCCPTCSSSLASMTAAAKSHLAWSACPSSQLVYVCSWCCCRCCRSGYTQTHEYGRHTTNRKSGLQAAVQHRHAAPAAGTACGLLDVTCNPGSPSGVCRTRRRPESILAPPLVVFNIHLHLIARRLPWPHETKLTFSSSSSSSSAACHQCTPLSTLEPTRLLAAIP